MDFSESPSVSALRREARELVEREVLPLERDFLEKGFAHVAPALNEKRERAKGTRLWAAHIPTGIGGGGLSLTEFAHVSEELGRTPLGHYLVNCQAPDVGNMEILELYGTPEQKERYLAPLIAGKIRSCFSMTEPELAGSNPVWLGTTAKADGDDWVIDGNKWFTSSAEGATFAVCMAITNPDTPEPHRRASMILVPTDTPGFVLEENLSIMGERGSQWASHARVSYRGVRVPRANLLGGEGEGFTIAQKRLGPGRIHHCMRWIGIAERALDILCRRAASRELSPGKPLGHKQIVQEWIAESRAEIHGSRLMVLHAAWQIERAGSSSAREEIALIKLTVARMLQRVLDRAIQALGGLGMTDSTPLAFWYAHERAARIYDGADEVHIESIAKRILRGYGLA
jgi:acyl-CoA dehydrogenase